MALRLVCTAILLCASEMWAAAVNGYVLNPLTDERIPGVEVAFYIRQDEKVSEVLRKEADAEGRFSFAGPFLQDGLRFALSASYQSIPYFSSTFEVGAQQQIILEVYEKTDDDSGIHIGSHHLFLSLRESTIECIQLLQVHNDQQRTFVGSGSGQERRVTEFALPPGLFDLQSHSGLMHQVGPDRFFDNQPLPPGPSQLSFSFNLDAREFDGDYLHQTIYPTERLEVFLDPASIEVGAPFVDQGTVDLHGRQYRRVALENLAPGQQVTIPLPLSPSLRWSLKWAALAGILLVVGAALTLSQDRPDTPSLQERRQRRQYLLAELARLDDTHADQPQDPNYLEQRKHLMQEAVALTRALEK